MIKVLIVDDHPMVRAGLRAFLRVTPNMEIVGDTGSVDEAVRLALTERPDVVLMDLVFPAQSGLQGIRRLTALHPAPRVVALTSFGEPGRAADALAAGATSYLLKTVAPEELAAAIEQAVRGRGVWDARPAAGGPEVRGDALTPREREVLSLLGDGMDNRAIATRLGIAVKTVKTHTSRIYEKLGVNDRTEAVVVAARGGLISLGREEFP